MKIDICSPCSKEFWPIGKLTVPSKVSYADRWGMQFHSPEYIQAAHDHGWGRIDFMQEHLHGVDWLWFMGADVMIVNQTVDCKIFLRDDADLIAAWDDNGLQSDSMFIRNCPKIHELFNEVRKRRETDFDLSWLAGTEQGCLVRTLAGLEAYENALPVERLQEFGVRVKQAPDEINRYPQNYRARDMVVHVCNMTTEERMRWLTAFNRQIIY